MMGVRFRSEKFQIIIPGVSTIPTPEVPRRLAGANAESITVDPVVSSTLAFGDEDIPTHIVGASSSRDGRCGPNDCNI